MFKGGVMDDVRIYNRALTAREVQQLYHLGTANAAHSNTVALSNGLVGYWPFDGSTIHWATGKADDLSGHGNTGTLVNMSTTTSPTAGKIGQALKFDGSTSYLNMGDQAILDLTGDFAFSAWVKPNPGPWHGTIVNKNFLTGYLFRLQNYGSGNFYVTLSTGGQWESVYTASIVPPNVWTHVLVTGTMGSTATIYVNGVAAATHAILAPTYGTESFSIADNLGPYYFNGSIDDVRIYNRALTAGEVKQLYKLGTANAAHSNTIALSNGLVGYWTFDGPATHWNTNTTDDVSGNGNTGTLVNTSTTTSPVAGKIGQALQFTNRNSAQVLTTFTSALTDFTVCAWFYAGTLSNYGRIVDKLFYTGFWIGHNGASSNNQWGGGIEEGAPYGHYVTLSPNQWHHMCMSRQGTTKTIIADGGAMSTQATVVNTAIDTTPLRIGTSQNNPTGDGLDGRVDDVRIYNRALSPTEVKQLYHMGQP